MGLHNSERQSGNSHLLPKVMALTVLVLALAVGLAVLFQGLTAVPVVVFHAFADASIGVLVGLATRILLRHRNWFIKALTSAAISIVGLIALGYLTAWGTGIGPLQVDLVRVNWLDWAHIALLLPLQLRGSTMDILDLAQAAIAVDMSWIALRAWNRGRRVVARSAVGPLHTGARAQPALSQMLVVPSSQPVARVRVPAGTNVRPRVKRRTFGRALISSGAAAVSAGRPRSTRWKAFRRKAAVQLAVHEEHRCPYCLEDVNRNDPRGAVECPVCHTLHHKDCWDITGTCQVPHLNP